MTDDMTDDVNDSLAVLDDDLAERIRALIQLDIDATIAYAQAIAGVDEEHGDIALQLEAFKLDHVRHVEDLSNALLTFGCEPPPEREDAKGFLLAGMTAIRAKLGTVQTLEAMRHNELLANHKYDAETEALTGVPEQIADAIVRAREDERRHLEYVERTLAAFDEAAEIDRSRVT